MDIYKIINLQIELSHARFEYWENNIIFTWRWWLAVIVFFAVWGYFKYKVESKRLLETVIVGFIVTTVAVMLDEIGIELGLWSYLNKPVPIFPHFMVLNFGVLPVVYMLVFQHHKDWNGYLKSLVLIATAFAFIGEPLLVYGEFYILLKWKYYYGFPIYILLGIFAKLAVESLAAKAKR